MVVEKEQAFADRIDNLIRRAGQSVRFSVQERRQEVLSLTQHRIFQNFQVRLFGLEQRVDLLESRAWEAVRGRQRQMAESKSRAALSEQRLVGALRALLSGKRAAWERLAAGLQGNSPLNVLKKGFAVVWDGERTPIADIKAVRVDDPVIVSFYKGEFSARVTAVDRVKPAVDEKKE
jgi:exonuclease VII large subunit